MAWKDLDDGASREPKWTRRGSELMWLGIRGELGWFYLTRYTRFCVCVFFFSKKLRVLNSGLNTHTIHVILMVYLTYIYHKNQPNVGKYTIHGWYGIMIIDFIYCLTLQSRWLSHAFNDVIHNDVQIRSLRKFQDFPERSLLSYAARCYWSKGFVKEIRCEWHIVEFLATSADFKPNGSKWCFSTIPKKACLKHPEAVCASISTLTLAGFHCIGYFLSMLTLLNAFVGGDIAALSKGEYSILQVGGLRISKFDHQIWPLTLPPQRGCFGDTGWGTRCRNSFSLSWKASDPWRFFLMQHQGAFSRKNGNFPLWFC